MEATNISVNKQSSVSINVDALQAIKKRVLSATDNSSLLPYRAKFLTLGNRKARFPLLSLNRNFHFSLSRLYRKELRMARAVAAWCDRHSTQVNWLMAIQVMVFAFYVFLFV